MFGGIAFGSIFCIESIVNLLSLFLFDSSSESLSTTSQALLVVYYAVNLLGLCVLLALFARAVSDLQSPGSPTLTMPEFVCQAPPCFVGQLRLRAAAAKR